MKRLMFALAAGFACGAWAGDVTADGVRTLTDTTVTVASEAELGEGVTKVVLDNATLNFNLAADATLAKTYEAKNGGRIGICAGRTATIASTLFLKPSLGNVFGKTGAGQLNIGTKLDAVSAPTTFEVFEGTVRLTTGDFFGGHSAATTNFAIKVHAGATWHNGSNHCSVGPVELTGATWISDNPEPYSGFWAETSFKGGIVVHPADTPSKIYSTSWDFLTQPLSTNPNASQCVIDVETGADLYVYADLHDGSGQKSVLVKRGGGALHLLGAGSWTGGTVLEAGSLVLGHADALGKSPVTVSDGVTLAVNPGLSVTCPEVKGAGTITVDGPGGLAFGTVASTVSGAANRAADPYTPFADGVLAVQAGVNDLDVPAGQTVTLADVQERDPGSATVADIRKTGAGTLVLGEGLAGKYRRLLVTDGIVAFSDNSCFGMSGVGNKGGVEISGGRIRPTADYRSPKTRFTFVGANGGLDVPEGVLFEASSNYFYSANATVTKTGKGGWQLVTCFYSNLTPVSGTRWVVDEGRLFTTSGGTFSGHSVCWNGTIEVHENGEFANDSPNHQPVGALVLRGGTVRTEISQFGDATFNVEGGGVQWGGFSFNGGIRVLASEKPSRVIARQCYVTQETLPACEVDVAEGAVLEMDTALRGGYSWSPSFRWQRGQFVKKGKGTLRLLRPLSLAGYAGATTLKGLLDVKSGTVELKEGGSIDPDAEIRVGDAAKLVLNDGTRFTARQADVAPAVLGEAEVWIDATRVVAADGDTLDTIENLGTCRGSFRKFPKAVNRSGGMIPNAPKFVAEGIGGRPSFGFDGLQALMLDTPPNTGYDCEVFVVGMWTNFVAAAGQGRWGAIVSCGFAAMPGGEDSWNKGVLSCYCENGTANATSIASIPVLFGSDGDNSQANRSSVSLAPPGKLANDEPFVLRMTRGMNSGSGEIWIGDDRVNAKSTGYAKQPTACHIDRIAIGTRLMTDGCATTYSSGTSTRNLIGELGEVIVFSRALTADERAAVNDYLRRKWIGTAAEVTPAVAAATAAALTVETPAGAKAALVAGLSGDGQTVAVTKTGAGELTVGGGAAADALDVTVQEGSVRLQDGRLASRVAVWIDADDAATCLLDDAGHVTNLVNKGFCGGSFGPATASGSVAPHVPVRTADGLNGRATLTFDGESAMMLTSYTNTTSPRRLSIYCVQRRNRWELHPGASNGGGYGKWATVCTLVPAKCTQDESQAGAYHVDESAAANAYAHLDFQNQKAVTSKAFAHPGTGVPAIFVSQVTTNGYFGAYETAATAEDKVVSKGAGGQKLGPYQIERVILGARANGGAKVHYYGKDNTGNRCWYGDLAELVVTTEPLSLNEEKELMAYLRKKWLNKGAGTATPPAWLTGETATPRFGGKTMLAMADGTKLVHAASTVKLGALETAGAVDWTRVWDGLSSEGFALFDTESVALGAVNLTPRPSCPQGSVQLLAYGAKPAAKASWTVLKPDGRKLGVTVSERADGYWLAPASTMLFIR